MDLFHIFESSSYCSIPWFLRIFIHSLPSQASSGPWQIQFFKEINGKSEYLKGIWVGQGIPHVQKKKKRLDLVLQWWPWKYRFFLFHVIFRYSCNERGIFLTLLFLLFSQFSRDVTGFVQILKNLENGLLLEKVMATPEKSGNLKWNLFESDFSNRLLF